MIDASQIREHMHVHSSDDEHLGRVDHVKGDGIELAKMDLATLGKHRHIPLSWIDRLEDDRLVLSKTAEDVKADWD